MPGAGVRAMLTACLRQGSWWRAPEEQGLAVCRASVPVLRLTWGPGASRRKVRGRFDPAGLVALRRLFHGRGGGKRQSARVRQTEHGFLERTPADPSL